MTRLQSDESGLSTLEKLGIAAIIISALAFIPPVRGALGDLYDAIFKQVDADTGEVTAFSVAARGILVTLVSIIAFVGTGYLLLYTNLGAKLAFLVTGAATFGWMVIGGALFVVYAPRGLRPRSVEGLNALQIRIPAIAMTIGSFILFLMFIVALDRYEKVEQETA
jgi:hypothetical protein